MPTTFEKEDSLPRLPLPELKDSTMQALSALKPLILDSDFEKLVKEGEDFVNSKQAQILQQHLAELAKTNNNYLNSEGIFSTTSNVYGDLRGLTLPRNPFFILEDDPMINFAPTQEYRAAVLTTSSLRFIVALKQGTLKPDVNPITNQPLTMSSYKNLFGTTVISENNGVGLKKSLNSKHIIFLSRGQFYSLTVLTENDQIWFSKHELSAVIKHIINDSLHERSKYNVGTFTTESKSTWKMARLALETSNAEQMQIIDSALFVVCLDHENFNINDTTENKIQFVSHGTSKIDSNGIQYGTCVNRYYDKLNLVITKNATAACIYPASIIDGTTVLRFISDIYTDSVLRLARHINGKNYTLWTEINTIPVDAKIVKPDYERVKFNLTNETCNGLHLAESRLGDIINQHEYVAKKINIGKRYIKEKMKLAPDSFLQICIQITYYALYGKCPSTFEPVSTRRFRDARTEPICIPSGPILDLCQAFISQTSDSEKWKLLLEAVKNHKEMAKKASMGLGFERHLSALRSAFIQRNSLNNSNTKLPKIEGTSIPPFIFNPHLENLYKPELIAANCGNPALDYFGITPSIPSGFGLGYIIKDNYITIVGSSQWRQTGRFLDTLERVFVHLRQIWKDVIAHPPTRDTELQSYVQSIPMDMVASNNSNWLPSVVSKGGSTSGKTSSKEADAYILGGYDYFDVEQLNFRSELASRVQSRTISRVNSQANLGKSPSFKNVNSAQNHKPITVGRVLKMRNDI